MIKVTNKFGTQEIYTIEDVQGDIHCVCTACLSVWTDFLSWANAHPLRVCKHPGLADSIVVLGCQVTDLAVLNDLRTLEEIHESYPKATFYISGCLAQRFDIELPEWVRRLDVTRITYQELNNLELVKYQKPFWKKHDKKGDLEPGNLFSPGTNYPLKIGAGCPGKCAYCTIRDTRGKTFTSEPSRQIEEFAKHENILLVADNITDAQFNQWADAAQLCAKFISIRNMEPGTAVRNWDRIQYLSERGLLKVLHVPIQSLSVSVLEAMHRDPLDMINFTVKLLTTSVKLFTKVATNLIVDYVMPDGSTISGYTDYVRKDLDLLFNYYTWNPYWDGVWNRERAEARWKTYIEDEKYPL